MVRAAHPGFGVAAILAVAPIGFFAAVMAAAFGDVHFAADDGLDVALASFVEKISRGKEIAMVRDSHGRHFLAGRFIQELGGFASSIEQAVIRMNVKVNKLRLTHGTRF